MSLFTLEELKETVELFSATQCDFFVENCIVALENYNHKTGCKLEVEGDKSTSFELHWSKDFKRNGYKEEKKIIEHSAETLSFFLATALTEFNIIQEGIIGSGFDYWLGYSSSHEKYNPRNFMLARLEISGIGKATASNSLMSRVNSKTNQTNVSDDTQLPAYISVVEHFSPKAYFRKK